mmetsp:Transcript_115958/g.259268  ORF Transcript_115958/g.259268 Transcript_115958/m.259268 type:complete len:208 (-) Transcript_115958:26-649(-)
MVGQAERTGAVHTGLAVAEQDAPSLARCVCQLRQHGIVVHDVVLLCVLGDKLTISDALGRVESRTRFDTGASAVEHVSHTTLFQHLQITSVIAGAQQEMREDLRWPPAELLDVSKVQLQKLAQLPQGLLCLLGGCSHVDACAGRGHNGLDTAGTIRNGHSVGLLHQQLTTATEGGATPLRSAHGASLAIPRRCTSRPRWGLRCSGWS